MKKWRKSRKASEAFLLLDSEEKKEKKVSREREKVKVKKKKLVEKKEKKLSLPLEQKDAHGCCVLFYICPLDISPPPPPLRVSPKQTNKKREKAGENTDNKISTREGR